MPEEIDPYQQAAYDAYKRRQAEYEATVATAPKYEKPGFWRSLAAIGAGAFGGSQYDKGGMQWGQQIGQQIIEGPYQRRMNEHLKELAAKRQGLDVAQEGLGVLGQIEARKQQAAIARQNAEDRKAAEADKLYQRSQYAQGVYEKDLNKSTEGNYQVYRSKEEALKAKTENPDLAGYELREDPVEVPGVGRRYYLAESSKDRQNRKSIDISATVANYNQIAPKVGLPTIDNPGRVSKEEATVRLNEAKELYRMKFQADANNLGYARIAAMVGRGGDGDSKAYAAAEKFKHQETDKVNSEFQNLKTQKENAYQAQIARALANGNKDEAERLATARGQELAEALNNAHMRIANIWGHKKFKQVELKDGKMVETWVGEGVNQPPDQQPAQPAAPKVLTKEIAKQFLQEAGMDQAKAEAMARAQGYNWK